MIKMSQIILPLYFGDGKANPVGLLLYLFLGIDFSGH